MHERRIRLAIFSAMALGSVSHVRAQEILDENGNSLLTIHTREDVPFLPNDPPEMRDFVVHKERTYDPRPKANLDKLRGRNFNRPLKSQFKGKGHRPS